MSRFSPQLLKNLEQNNLKPIIVLQIDGLPFIIGSDTIKKIPRYGDEGLTYGLSGLFYGGLVPLDPSEQKTLISTEGITRSITQTLDIDKGSGSSVSTFSLTLTDLNGEATKIASGQYVDDNEMLYRDVIIWIGFGETSAFNDDYVVIFRGVIESLDYQQAKVKFNFASSDVKRNQSLAFIAGYGLDSGITNSAGTALIDVFAARYDEYLEVPDILYNAEVVPIQDPSILTYLKIDDEFMRYDFRVGGSFNLVERGSFGTTAASHSSGATADGFIVLEGHPIDLALKLLLSGSREGFPNFGFFEPYLELDVYSFNDVPSIGFLRNAIYFPNVNLIRDQNVTIGDYITIGDAANPTNNMGNYNVQIFDVQFIGTGSYVLVDDFFGLVVEIDSPARAEFKSKYATFGAYGLGMTPAEIDIQRFEELKNNFLLAYEARIFVREEISNVREFIDRELLLPFGCYSLPNDKGGLGRLSVGINLPPIPIEQIQEINLSVVKNPESLTTRRSINKYHYNVVGFRYEDSALDEELRKRRFFFEATPSVKASNRSFIIDSRGLKEDLGAANISSAVSTRLLNRYKNASEFFPNVQVLFSLGVLINIGDRVLVNFDGLNIVDKTTGLRSGKAPILMEVINKTTDPLSGNISLDLLDTGFNITSRYGLVSPSSRIDKVVTSNRFTITKSFGGLVYGNQEYSKWLPYVGANVVIRSTDFTYEFQTRIQSIDNNSITVFDTPMSPILPGYIMEFDSYSEQLTPQVLIIFAHLGYGEDADVPMSSGELDFPDGKENYRLI